MSWIRDSNEKTWFVYVIREDGAASGPVKIGTAKNVAYRVAGLQNGNPRRLLVAYTISVSGRDAALKIERAAHKILDAHRLPGRDWINTDANAALDAINAAVDQMIRGRP